tara:strand:+ start:951 stop:1850 length:900 start_codon:yes stop_codon:yes gene_type:complete
MTKARDLANVISGSGVLASGTIPDLPASKITSGTLGADRVPDLATSKITSGTFADARLSSSSVTQHVDLTALSASNLTSGTVPSARLSLGASDIPNLATSKITSGTFADALFAASNITQHVDLSNLSASNLTSGTMPDARFPATLPAVSGANLTSMSVASSTGSWTPSMQVGSTGGVSAVYVKVGKMVHARCSFYLSGAQSSRSGTLLRIAGLPFTSASGNTYAGGGMILGYSGTEKAQVFVEQNNTTCVFAKDYKSPYHNIDLAYGALARRHSLIDGVESGGNYNFYYTMFCTYVTAS